MTCCRYCKEECYVMLCYVTYDMCDITPINVCVCGWVALADFPAVFFHICNFDICHEIQIPKDENKSQLSRAIY